MNISSQMEKAHRGMPHKQPFHELTHPLCSSGVYTGEDGAAYLRALFSMWRSCVVWFCLQHEKPNSHLQPKNMVHMDIKLDQCLFINISF